MGTIRGRYAYFTSLKYKSTFRVELPVPKGPKAGWFEEGAGGGGMGHTRSYEERNATEKEIAVFLEKAKKIKDEERREDEKWAKLLALAGLKLSNFSRIREVWQRKDKIYVLTRDYGRARTEKCGSLLKSYPDEDPTYWHYEFRLKAMSSVTGKR